MDVYACVVLRTINLGRVARVVIWVVIIVISWLQASKSMYRSDEISVIGYQVIGNKCHDLVYSVLKHNFNKNA